MKIFNDGSYMTINNNQDYTKTYLSTIKDVGATFTNELSKVPKNKHIYFMVPNKIELFTKKEDPIMHLLYDFNIWN